MGASSSIVNHLTMKVGICLVLVAFAAFSWSAATASSCPAVQLFTPWPGGRNGVTSFQAPSDLDGWKIVLKFDRPVTKINPYNGQKGRCRGNTCTFSNVGYNKRQ